MLTRDHVVPRSVLKSLLGIDKYAEFSAMSRYVNIQILCVECNNKKGSLSIDYRPWNERIDLIMLLRKWKVDGKLMYDLIDFLEDFEEEV
jgi:5-methylcytosine-specific restriction endonuclease McrA